MNLWKKASGALKDRNSILAASIARRTSYRNPDLEAAIIKATSHDEFSLDYKNFQRVFAWLRTSPVYVKPLIWGLSRRMLKTRSWVVALKGLILMHGVFCCNLPAVHTIGRLPFDMSNFMDKHTKPGKRWIYSAFIRLYFTFLDQRAVFMCMESKGEVMKESKSKTEERSIGQELVKLQKLQTLLDMLLLIKPLSKTMHRSTLILEAMDCVVIEIFDIYSAICDGIARVLLRIYAAGKFEASMALKVLKKATKQGQGLAAYFEFCRDIGVLNASELPKVEHIPDEDIHDLERVIMSGANSGKRNMDVVVPKKEDDKAVVVSSRNHAIDEHQNESSWTLETVITNEWEVFEDDLKAREGIQFSFDGERIEDHPSAIQPYAPAYNNQNLPDLIIL
ncbi:putative clathrin assembly protein At1g25240 [Malania oleifera]|uniref:putative clathrin assembly protein At1g25240 n=1 Tax=Malania oleifera TaxID=397392 RepID=UPI0025AEB1B2|nr:putative clathrin assembly protein At1g25240 [Malania oleifera]